MFIFILYILLSMVIAYLIVYGLLCGLQVDRDTIVPQTIRFYKNQQAKDFELKPSNPCCNQFKAK